MDFSDQDVVGEPLDDLQSSHLDHQVTTWP